MANESKGPLADNAKLSDVTVKGYTPPHQGRPRLDEEEEEKARRKGKPVLAVDAGGQPIYEASVLDRMEQRFRVQVSTLGPLSGHLRARGYTGPFKKDQVITRADLGPDAEALRLCEQGALLPLPG